MPSNGPGLTRSQFSAFLRLVALAQSGQELSDDLCGSALDPVESSLRFGGLLPPPNLRAHQTTPSPASRWVAADEAHKLIHAMCMHQRAIMSRCVVFV